MSDFVKILAAFLAGYLLGSLNTAIIVGKCYGKDVKSLGSKSGGLTNAYRVLGRFAAIIVIIGDILKGLVSCYIGLSIGVICYWGGVPENVSILVSGAGAIIGHNWPVYFKFRGGKGGLTGLAVLFMINWVMAILCVSLFIATIIFTRYVSLGTILGSLLFAILSFIPVFGNYTPYFNIFSCLVAFIVILKHKDNIGRLFSGTENKLVFNK